MADLVDHMVSVAASQLCHCNPETARASGKGDGCGRGPRQLDLPNQAVVRGGHGVCRHLSDSKEDHSPWVVTEDFPGGGDEVRRPCPVREGRGELGASARVSH